MGRLDYLSEGLLLMTNDGELANLLTKAGSGVEKTYLVKVAGQPTEEELERLRGGVAIERGEAGSARVRTAPARIRQVRQGDNPWYEVVLTEGRNRELRKMFEAIGHFVEKIRRVGYGPLVLDVEPGKMRELTPEEVKALRLTAEGKIKPRRLKVDISLPKDAGRNPAKRSGKGWDRGPGHPSEQRSLAGGPGRDRGNKKATGRGAISPQEIDLMAREEQPRIVAESHSANAKSAGRGQSGSRARLAADARAARARVESGAQNGAENEPTIGLGLTGVLVDRREPVRVLERGRADRLQRSRHLAADAKAARVGRRRH